MKKILFSLIILIASTIAFPISWLFAQTNPIFVQLGQAKGALYKPDSGPTLQVGIELHEQHRLQRILEKRFCGSLHELTI